MTVLYLGPHIHFQESIWGAGSCERRVHSINLQRT